METLGRTGAWENTSFGGFFFISVFAHVEQQQQMWLLAAAPCKSERGAMAQTRLLFIVIIINVIPPAAQIRAMSMSLEENTNRCHVIDQHRY